MESGCSCLRSLAADGGAVDARVMHFKGFLIKKKIQLASYNRGMNPIEGKE